MPPGNGTDPSDDPEDAGTTIDSGTDPIEDAGSLPDVSDPEDLPDEPFSFPERISTSGAAFSGTMEGNEKATVILSASRGDRVIIWLRKAEGTNWNPYVAIRDQGDTDPIVYGNPSGNDDASIPYRVADIADGWELKETTDYALDISNISNAGGSFSFELTCVGGPCAFDENDRDADGRDNASDNCPDTPNEDQADNDGDGIGDVCDPDGGSDPYPDLEDDALEDALRADRVHIGLSYDSARDALFEFIDNDNGFVESVYVGERIQTTERPPGSVMNTEHTWPQSRGAGTGDAKSDLHHLFPARPDVNSRRSNNFYGVVTDASWEEAGSRYGKDSEGRTRFEPRDAHKGDVARALFYFAVMYENDIEPDEEALLRQWHARFPPGDDDRARNNRVAQRQRSRNPFVDYPDLVDRISDF